ncbi:hypothetical protein ASZ90_017253 [hydrocarbon metagenome]|uniref:Methyltransferase domain-containing protein n=1 Tax=hydrocarbon metagenome TaxID=938273 RepID=A0A0W8EA86_9ZZZZ
MDDIIGYMQNLLISEPLREPVLKNALFSLNLPADSKGLDVGCGLGMVTRLLASMIGSGGHVIGLDTNPVFIEQGRSLADQTDCGQKIAFQVGDASQLPWGDNTFDWACSVDFVGYGSLNTTDLLRELVRVVKPGGIVFIMAWSSQMLLPGYPFLEAGLNATPSGMAPFSTGIDPAQHFLRGRSWFSQAGLPDAQARTFVGSINAPLSSELRSAIIDLIQMRWGNGEPRLSADMRQEYQRLTTAESPDFILNIPEYYAFFTYTMIYATVL